jgi:phosphogluconate dehydratase
MKVSAVPDDRWQVEAPARVFVTQDAVLNAYRNGELNCDVVVVLKYQGPKANGMPELHQLTPALTNLQEAGYRVALVTDGRLSGASGKVPAAIHVCPEAYAGGWLDRVQDGDVIRLDGHHGELTVLAEGFAQRPAHEPPVLSATGVGRELFAGLRKLVTPADQGALSVGWD